MFIKLMSACHSYNPSASQPGTYPDKSTQLESVGFPESPRSRVEWSDWRQMDKHTENNLMIYSESACKFQKKKGVFKIVTLVNFYLSWYWEGSLAVLSNALQFLFKSEYEKSRRFMKASNEVLREAVKYQHFHWHCWRYRSPKNENSFVKFKKSYTHTHMLFQNSDPQTVICCFSQRKYIFTFVI